MKRITIKMKKCAMLFRYKKIIFGKTKIERRSDRKSKVSGRRPMK